MRRVSGKIALSIFLLLFSIRAAAGQAPAAPPLPPYSQFVQGRVQKIISDLQSQNDWKQADQSITDLFDQTALYTPETQPDALREADFAMRLITQLEQTPADYRMDLLKLLCTSPNLAWNMVYMIQPGEKSADAYALLNQLRLKRPQQIEAYGNLAAAISIVHQQPLERHVNENTAKAIDPIDIFDYYVHNENRMNFGVRTIAPELLVYVVDVTGSIDELNWAMNKYQGNRNVGQLFFDVTYDIDSFRDGATKRVTQAGFTLPNILRYGGVCADQAYFATEVGKAIGVPTAVAEGASGEADHAWVGFIQAQGTAAWWNFDSGRYDAFQGVRGNVNDPATRQDIPDSYVSLTAEVVGTTPIIRDNAAALADAAFRLMDMEQNPPAAVNAPPAELLPGSLLPSARKADTTTELTLLEAALHQSVGCVPAWVGVRDLAVADKLTADQRNRWADMLVNFGAKKYPDFTLAIVSPMVSTIADVQQQNTAWNNLFAIFSNRFDLAADIRMKQAAMWDDQNQPDNAYTCYMDVINRYANTGPFVIDALKGAEKLLMAANQPNRVLPLYAQTWKNISLPQDMAQQFLSESNWYRVGRFYEHRLADSGQTARAELVHRELETRTIIGGG